MNGLQKLNELRKQAKERGIEGYAKMKTAELEAILTTAVVTETAERTGEPVEVVSERLLPTVEEVKFPPGTPEYDTYVSELGTELTKFAAGAAPYEYEAERGITNVRDHTPGIVLRDGGRLTAEEVETIFAPEPEDTEPFEGDMEPGPGDDEYPAPAPVHPIDRPTGPKRGIVPQRHMTKHKTPKVSSRPSRFRR